MEHKYTAIILNKWDVGETDRIYTMYTFEAGKIKSLAKGVRKPQAKLAASLESIILADVTIVKSRGLGKITSSIVENNFSALKRDGQALLAVLGVFQLFEKMVDFENQDQKVFLLLQQYLESVEQLVLGKSEEARYGLFRYGFLVKLLDKLGYALGVDSCVACGGKLQPEHIFFSSKQGGILCQNCVGGDKAAIPIKVNAVKLLRLFLQNEIFSFVKIKTTSEDFDNLQMVVDDFLRWNL